MKERRSVRAKMVPMVEAVMRAVLLGADEGGDEVGGEGGEGEVEGGAGVGLIR